MAAFLERYIAGVVITRAEDAALRTHKLARRMPAGAEPHDRLARYRMAGISFEPEDEARLAG